MELDNYYLLNSEFLLEDISSDLLKIFGKNRPVIVCLGSDKILADMVGVFVGDFLRKANVKTVIFGGTKRPINKNMFLSMNKRFNTNNFLIIDSGIVNFGDIKVCDKTKLCNGITVNYPSIVAGTIKSFDKKLSFTQKRYFEIIKYAKIIASAIIDFFSYTELISHSYY